MRKIFWIQIAKTRAYVHPLYILSSATIVTLIWLQCALHIRMKLVHSTEIIAYSVPIGLVSDSTNICQWTKICGGCYRWMCFRALAWTIMLCIISSILDKKQRALLWRRFYSKPSQKSDCYNEQFDITEDMLYFHTNIHVITWMKAILIFLHKIIDFTDKTEKLCECFAINNNIPKSIHGITHGATTVMNRPVVDNVPQELSIWKP